MFNGEEQRFDDYSRSHIVDQESFMDASGVLMKKVVPADNSCLFTSVGYVLNGKQAREDTTKIKILKETKLARQQGLYSKAVQLYIR